MVESRLLTARMAQGKEKYMKVQEKSNLEKQMLMHTIVLFWKMKNLYKRSSCDLLRSHFFYYAKFFLTFGVENFLPFEYIQSKHLSYGPATSLVLIEHLKMEIFCHFDFCPSRRNAFRKIPEHQLLRYALLNNFNRKNKLH